jgi:hypothetical protein
MRPFPALTVLAALLAGCAQPPAQCERLDGGYLFTATLRSGGSACPGVLESVEVYRDGVAQGNSSVECTGFRSWTANRCELEIAESCVTLDTGCHAERTGTLSHVTHERIEGVLELYISDCGSPLRCVYDVVQTKQ